MNNKLCKMCKRKHGTKGKGITYKRSLREADSSPAALYNHRSDS